VTASPCFAHRLIGRLLASAQVVAEHPEYHATYCPGTVQEDLKGELVVVFYDNTAVRLKGTHAICFPEPR
jgi:hypothetical protein